MFPAKCYCFTVAKTNAAISLERVNNAAVFQAARRRHCSAVFPAESLIEHCQVVRSVNIVQFNGEQFAFVRRCSVLISYANTKQYNIISNDKPPD